MNTTEFYKLHEDDLLTNFTKGDLIYYLKKLTEEDLFDVVCDNCLGFLEDTITYAAACMIEKRDDERALENIIAENATDSEQQVTGDEKQGDVSSRLFL